jgi:hypothetical protein
MSIRIMVCENAVDAGWFRDTAANLAAWIGYPGPRAWNVVVSKTGAVYRLSAPESFMVDSFVAKHTPAEAVALLDNLPDIRPYAEIAFEILIALDENVELEENDTMVCWKGRDDDCSLYPHVRYSKETGMRIAWRMLSYGKLLADLDVSSPQRAAKWAVSKREQMDVD